MSVKIEFQKNAFHESFKDKLLTFFDDKVVEHVQKKFKYEYGNVKYPQFCRHYKANGWVGRKFTALPNTLTSIVHLVLHVALTILDRFANSPTGRDIELKGQVYFIKRDAQEIYGHLATIINDRYGQFHVQKSQFHNKCYDYHLQKERSSYNPNRSNPSKSSSQRTPSFTVKDLDEEFKRLKKKVFPDDNLYVILAKKYLHLKKKQKAQKAIGEVFDYKLKEPVYLNIAHAYFIIGKLEKARKVIDKIIYDTNSKEKSYLQIAEAYFSQGNYTDTLKTIDKIIYDTGSKEKSYLQIAEAYFSQGNYTDTLKTIDKIIYDTASKEKSYLQIAEAYLKKGNWKEALRIADKIIFDSKSKKEFKRKVKGSYETDNRSGSYKPKYFSSTGSGAKKSENKSKTSSKNHLDPQFKVLKLKSTANFKEVRKAYLKLSKTLHPDRIKRKEGESDDRFNERKKSLEDEFKKVSNAYEILSKAFSADDSI